MRLRAIACCLFLAAAGPAFGSERYALVVTGASGGEQFSRQYDTWRTVLVSTLRETFDYPADHVRVLAETPSDGVARATSTNVRNMLAELARKTTKEDSLLVLLIGHGSGETADEAKFNLVGPDLSAREWADLLRPVAARIVFVDAASGSFSFLEKLSTRGRIVITANQSPGQQFETVFPGFFINAFADQGADLDKNGRTSIWEAFSYASAGVRRWFDVRTQIATERAILDDTGDGLGSEADAPDAVDGTLARVTFLQPGAPIGSDDSQSAALRRRRADIELELDALRGMRELMRPEDYQAALEKLLLEIAQIDRQLRSKS